MAVEDVMGTSCCSGGKSTETVQKGNKFLQIPTDTTRPIANISDEDETTPLSKLYPHSVIKEEPDKGEPNKNQVKHLVE
jgi:hypothetical protein